MKRHTFRFSLAVACALSAATARGQTALDIPEIRIDASRGMQLRDMDVSTTVIPREAIQAAPQQTVDQILNQAAGVYLPQIPTTGLHPTGQSITMRGFGGRGAERTLVMVDGIPVNDAFFRYIDWTKIPKETIERIEIIRGGGATSLWGNMAMGGVINIVTRDPKPGEKWLTVAGGMNTTTQADAGATVFANDQWLAAIDGSLLRTNGYNQTPDIYRNGHTVSTTASAENFGGKLIWTPVPDTRFYIKASYHAITEDGLVYDVAKNSYTGFDLSLGGRTKLSDGSAVNVDGWYGGNTIETHNAGSSGYTYTKPTTGGGAAIYLGAIGRTPYHDYGGSAVWSKDFGPRVTDVKIGVDGRNIVGGDATQTYNQAGAALGFSQVSGQQWFEGVFAQATYHVPWFPLDVTVGLREDFWRVSSGTFNNTALPDGQQYAHFDPRIGLKYHITPNLDLRAAAYRNFGAPGMNQTFRTYFSGNQAFQANSALSPEYNTGAEVGADWRIGPVTLTINAFYNSLSSVIDSASICGGAPLPACASLPASAVINPGTYTTQTKYYNVGDATVRGFEVLGGWKVSDNLSVNASYSMNDAFLTSNSGIAAVLGQSLANKAEPLNAQLANVPPWMALAGVTWTPLEKWSLSADVKAFPAYWNNTAHTALADGAAVVDLSARYQLTDAAQLFLTGQNLTARRYYATPSTSASTPPQLGLPAFVLVGVRIHM